MAQLLLAADLMHRKNIIHRDLKPDNILMMEKKDFKICITDLGLACKVDAAENQLSVKCGTPGYVAPEILKGYSATTKSDIFSIGCFFYNLLTGKNLFAGKDAKSLLLANKFQNPESAIYLNV